MNFFRDLQLYARTLKLSKDEKQAMRIELYDLMERSSPAHAGASAPRAVKSPYVFLSFISVRATAALLAVVVVLVGTGTAYAAQGALPGSPLYPIKVHVNEQIQTALATTPEAKAQVNAALAQERLQEAEQLAAQGQLTASTSAQLAENFDEHAKAAQAIAGDLAANDPGLAAQLSAQLDATLQAHDAILSQIDESASSNDRGSIIAALRSYEHEGEGTFVALSATASSSQEGDHLFGASTLNNGSSTLSSSAENSNSSHASAQVARILEQHASSTLAQAQSDYAAIAPSLSSSSDAQAQSIFADINARMSAGQAALQSDNTSFAAANFEEALNLAVRLDAFLKAGKWNRRLLPSLLQNISGSGKGKGNDNGENGNHGNSSASVHLETNVNNNEGAQGSGDSHEDIHIATSTQSGDGNASASASVEIHASNESHIEIDN